MHGPKNKKQKNEEKLQQREQMISKIMTGVEMTQHFENGWE